MMRFTQNTLVQQPRMSLKIVIGGRDQRQGVET
jgi:hypothetical protein